MVEQLGLRYEHPHSDGVLDYPGIGIEVAPICIPSDLYSLIDLQYDERHLFQKEEQQQYVRYTHLKDDELVEEGKLFGIAAFIDVGPMVD